MADPTSTDPFPSRPCAADPFPTDPLRGLTFEELVADLEAVARQMDSSELGIEAAAELYGRAARLHAAASERLAAVQLRLNELRKDEDR